MDSIDFPERNCIIGKDQPEYQPLYGHIADTPEAEATFCMKLSAEEIKELTETGNLWFTQLTFKQGFQPIRLSTTKPQL